MKAPEPNPAAVEWLESLANPTWWERGFRPGSVTAQPLLKVKYDDFDECGEWEPDFCRCMGSLPERIYSVDYGIMDEVLWLTERMEPRFNNTSGDWAKAKRRFRSEAVERFGAYGAWRQAKWEQERERVLVRRGAGSGNGRPADG